MTYTAYSANKLADMRHVVELSKPGIIVDDNVHVPAGHAMQPEYIGDKEFSNIGSCGTDSHSYRDVRDVVCHLLRRSTKTMISSYV